MKKPGGVFMQLHSKCNAIAMQLHPVKSNDCNNNKKGFPGNPYMTHFAHYKKEAGNGTKRETKDLLTF